MSEKHTTIRLHGALKAKAKVMMRHESFSNFTAFWEQLVRDRWDAKKTPQMEADLAKELETRQKTEPATPSPKANRSEKSKDKTGKKRTSLGPSN